MSGPSIIVHVGENTPFDESEWIKLTDATEQEWLDAGAPITDEWRETLRRLVEGDYPDRPSRAAEAALLLAADLSAIFGDYPDEAARLIDFLRALYSGRLLHERTRAREDAHVLYLLRVAVEDGKDDAALAAMFVEAEPLVALLVRVSSLTEERLRTKRLPAREAAARARALRAAVAVGHPAGEIARELGVARETVQRWLKLSDVESLPPPCDGGYTCKCPLHTAERERRRRRPPRQPAPPWVPKRPRKRGV